MSQVTRQLSTAVSRDASPIDGSIVRNTETRACLMNIQQNLLVLPLVPLTVRLHFIKANPPQSLAKASHIEAPQTSAGVQDSGGTGVFSQRL